ncbi:hypothetical protein BGZ99_007413 [Dissophora globulifera]|uniref:Sphingomyelin synthase-like domain-containing protein n=1 Tax=Dissophora globulifera TaxID=979702 RepID=A0A9P6RAU2_9FUNG|nr:hypothetical protein BGZ99_007413 [Dissophora globulifera]
MGSTTRADNLENLGSIDNLKASEDDLNRRSNTTMVSVDNNNDDPASSSPASAPAGLSSKRSLWDRCINSEPGRLLASLVYFVVVCIAMAFCNQFSDHRWVETGYTKILLEDRGFDIFPALKDITPANTFVMTSIVFSLIGIALICPTWTARMIVVRRVFWVVGTLSVYRALTLSVTTLPTPKEGCVPATERAFGKMFYIALQMIPGTVEACTDDIFSGHTVFMVTCAIQWRLYCRNKWATYCSYIYITVGLYYVVATRLHYSVDVVLAIFITYAAWSLYMAMIDVVMEKEYFGLQRHHEKYQVFDSRWAEIEAQEQSRHLQLESSISSNSSDPEKALSGQQQQSSSAALLASFTARRAQLEYRMNRLRGSGMGYDRGEHVRVAFVPMQYNVWLIAAVRWCDGLDLRMLPSSSDRAPGTQWNELAIDGRFNKRGETEEPSYAFQKQELDETDEQTTHGYDSVVASGGLDSIHVVGHAGETSSSALKTK